MAGVAPAENGVRLALDELLLEWNGRVQTLMPYKIRFW